MKQFSQDRFHIYIIKYNSKPVCIYNPKYLENIQDKEIKKAPIYV